MVDWIEDCRTVDADRVGEKAAYIGELFQKDFSIPAGFVVPPKVFQAVIEHNNLGGQIRSAVREVDFEDREAVERASKQVERLVQDASIPEEIQEEVREAYSEIHVSKGIRDAGEKAVDLVGSQRGTGPVAVRASVGEPETNFFPGEIGVNTVDDVFTAMKKVWASFFSPGSLVYHGSVDPLFSGFPLIIQDIVEPDASGFIFLDDKHDSSIHVEAYNGIGTLLREGGVSPDSWSIDRGDGRIQTSRIAEKNVKMQKDPRSGRFERTVIPSHERQERSIDAEQLTEAVNKALEIQEILGESLRIGFAVRSGSLFFTTVLPVTASVSVDRETGRVSNSRDTVRGVLTDSIDQKTAGERIVSVDSPDDVFLALGDRITGFVAQQGAVSSRTCLTALGRGRPFMLRAGDIVDAVPRGERIAIDFAEGRVTKQDAVQEEYVPDEGGAMMDQRPASRLISVGGRVDAADGVLELNPGFNVAGRGRLQLDGRQVTVVEDVGSVAGNCLLVQDFGTVFALVASDSIPEAVLVDAGALQEEAGNAAVTEVFGTLADAFEGRVGVLMQRFDETVATSAVSHGIDLFAAPSDRLLSFSNRLDRVERRYLLRRLRRLG